MSPGIGGIGAPDRPSNAIVLLPGMTLNATLFGASVRRDALEVEFCGLVLSRTGEIPANERGPMGPYLERLEVAVGEWQPWQTRPFRIAVAHSFGGMLLLAWLAGRPQFAPTGVVFIGTTAGPMFDAASLRLGRLGDTELRLPLGPFVPMWNSAFLTRGVKRLFSGGRLDAVRQDFETLRNPTDAAVDRMGWRNTDWRAMRSFRQAMDGFDVRAHLPDITTPAVILHGERDSLIAPERARELADALPNARLEMVPGAGHALPLTHPESVERAIHTLTA